MSRDNRSLLNSRSEAKRIYAQRQEIKRLEKEKDHYKHLYSEVKKQKDDVVEGLKDLRQFVYDELVDFNVRGSTETYCKIKDLLRMLGEIE